MLPASLFARALTIWNLGDDYASSPPFPAPSCHVISPQCTLAHELAFSCPPPPPPFRYIMCSRQANITETMSACVALKVHSLRSMRTERIKTLLQTEWNTTSPQSGDFLQAIAELVRYKDGSTNMGNILLLARTTTLPRQASQLLSSVHWVQALSYSPRHSILHQNQATLCSSSRRCKARCSLRCVSINLAGQLLLSTRNLGC